MACTTTYTNNATTYLDYVADICCALEEAACNFKAQVTTLAPVTARFNITTVQDVVVDWGDGIIETVTPAAYHTHEYASPGVYNVNFAFPLGGVGSNNDTLVIDDVAGYQNTKDIFTTDIQQWGCMSVSGLSFFSPNYSQTSADYPGKNIYLTRITATDMPNGLTNTSDMFNGCKNLEYVNLIENWDMTQVVYMGNMFDWCEKFNQNLNNWNTSNVQYMNRTFRGATSYDQPMSNWDTTKVVDMNGMFELATAFNRSLANFKVSNVTNFDRFMNGKSDANYSTANYDALLTSWAAQTVKPNLNIDFGTIKRTAASQTAYNTLDLAPNNWTIIDGGI